VWSTTKAATSPCASPQRSHVTFWKPKACSQYCTTAGVRAPSNLFISSPCCTQQVVGEENREQKAHDETPRQCVAPVVWEEDSTNPPRRRSILDLTNLSRGVNTHWGLLWVVACRHNRNSLALRERDSVLASARMSSLWTIFWNWVHATSIALPLARVGPQPIFFISLARCWQRGVGEEAIEFTVTLRSIL
jgi:hypothetical protein